MNIGIYKLLDDALIFVSGDTTLIHKNTLVRIIKVDEQRKMFLVECENGLFDWFDFDHFSKFELVEAGIQEDMFL